MNDVFYEILVLIKSKNIIVFTFKLYFLHSFLSVFLEN